MSPFLNSKLQVTSYKICNFESERIGRNLAVESDAEFRR